MLKQWIFPFDKRDPFGIGKREFYKIQMAIIDAMINHLKDYEKEVRNDVNDFIYFDDFVVKIKNRTLDAKELFVLCYYDWLPLCEYNSCTLSEKQLKTLAHNLEAVARIAFDKENYKGYFEREKFFKSFSFSVGLDPKRKKEYLELDRRNLLNEVSSTGESNSENDAS